MSDLTTEYLVIDDLSKGMNNWDPPHKLEAGYYVHGQNTYLSNRYPTARTGQTALSTNTPTTGTLLWAEPFTDASGTLSILCATGTDLSTISGFYKYTPGTDTFVHVWSPRQTGIGPGLGTVGTRIQSVVYENIMIVLPAGNPTDTGTFAYKWDGTDWCPLGGMLVADFETDETWTTSVGTPAADTTNFVQGVRGFKLEHGDSIYRESTYTLASCVTTNTSTTVTCGSTSTLTAGHRITGTGIAASTYVSSIDSDVSFTISNAATATGTITATFYTVWNFTAGPGIMSSKMWLGTAFTTSSRLVAQVYKYQAANLTFNVTFYDNFQDSSTKYTTYAVATTGAGTGWQTLQFKRSGGTNGGGGAVDFTKVSRIQFDVAGGSAGQYLTLDFVHWVQADSVRPKPGHILEVYKEQLMIGNFNDVSTVNGAPSTLAASIFRNAVARSPVALPDDHSDYEVFSGGRSLLESVDHITALRTYYDLMLVGKATSSWTFSGTGTNVSTAAQQITVGIDASTNIVELPWSLQFSFEHNVFAARLTNRAILSMPIQSTLANLSYKSSEIVRAKAIRWDRGRQVKWAWLSQAAATTDPLDIIAYFDYQLNAWSGIGSTTNNKHTVNHWCRYIDSNDVRRLVVIDGANNALKIEDSGGAYFQPSDTVMPAYVVLPYMSAKQPNTQPHLTKWMGVWVSLDQASTVTTTVQARFADMVEDFQAGDSTTGFTTYLSIAGTDHADSHWVPLGVSARYCQLKLATTDSRGDWAVLPPVIFEIATSDQRA